MKNVKTSFEEIKKKIVLMIKRISTKRERTKESFFLKHKLYKTAKMSISDLVYLFSNSDEWMRCDIIVRYLAIEEYYHQNSYGYSLYKKMQDSRKKQGYSKTAIAQFEELISSYDMYGYNETSAIVLDKELGLIDGSHRIALALFYKIPYITTYIINVNHPVEYSIDWFYKNNFTTNEIDMILKKGKELKQQVTKAFLSVIWSPAVPYSKEILADLSQYGIVLSTKHYKYTKEEYEKVVKEIYSIDDIESWKIEKKIEYMSEYSPELVAVELLFNNPQYRLKKMTGLPISVRGERTKKAIRTKYSKKIDNYYFDIIIHIGDNIYQSEFIKSVLNI